MCDDELPSDGLPQDTDVLRTLVATTGRKSADLGQFPCAGVYALFEESRR